MKRILVISGKQGSGKSTQSELVAKIAVTKDFVPRVFKFAEPLYEMHNALVPILKKHGLFPEGSAKDGDLLQVLGTEYGRNCRGWNVWVDICRKRVDEWLALSEKHIAIIDDCRFPNEFDAFEDALRVRLDAPEAVRKERCSYWRENQTHLSETALDEYVMKGKFGTKWSGIYSTEYADKTVVAKGIWERMERGFY